MLLKRKWRFLLSWRKYKALEGSVSDLELTGRLLDEFDLLQKWAQSVNLDVVDSKVISKWMPELGFGTDDSDRLVASFSGGWQMRMCLGKILLQVYYTTCFYCIVYFLHGYEICVGYSINMCKILQITLLFIDDDSRVFSYRWPLDVNKKMNDYG